MSKITMYTYQPLLTDTLTTAPPAYDTADLPNHDLKVAPPTYTPVATNAKVPTQSLTIQATRVLPPITFPSQPSLQTDFNISESDWTLFTQELQRAAAPTACQKTLAVLSGIGTAGVILEPWTASLVARWVWQTYTVRQLKKGLDAETGTGVGEVLKTWNEKWGEIGVSVRVEIPESRRKAANGCGGERGCHGGPSSCNGRRTDCHGPTCCGKQPVSIQQQSGCCAKQSRGCRSKQRRCAERDESCGANGGSCGRKNQCCAGNEAKRLRIVVEKLEGNSLSATQEKQVKD